MRDAAADALVAQAEIAVEAVGRRADAVVVEVHRLIADHRILDVVHDLVPRHGLDVVRVDVDDEPVLQLAPAGGAAGVLEDLAAVGRGVDDLGRQHLRHAGHVAGSWLAPRNVVLSDRCRCRPARSRPAGAGTRGPSSIGPSRTSRSISETATSISVGGQRLRALLHDGRHGAVLELGLGVVEPHRGGDDLRQRLVGDARGLALRRPAPWPSGAGRPRSGRSSRTRRCAAARRPAAVSRQTTT